MTLSPTTARDLCALFRAVATATRPAPPPPVTATADEVVAWVRLLGHAEVTEGAVRVWANRGLIGRHGTRGRRTLYSLAEVQELLASRLAQDDLGV